MGQYYNPVILKKDWKENEKPVRASLKCYDYGNGAKMMEHSYVHNDFVDAVLHLIHELDKDQTGVPFVWCGDYADSISIKYFPTKEIIDPITNEVTNIEGGFQAYDEAYNWMYDKYDQPTEEFKAMRELVKDSSEHRYDYCVNHTKKQILIVPAYEECKWVIHPFPILCSDGTGFGSGDYNTNYCINPEEKDYNKKKYAEKHNAKFVGTWAYDLVSVTNDKDYINNLKDKGYTVVDWELEYD